MPSSAIHAGAQRYRSLHRTAGPRRRWGHCQLLPHFDVLERDPTTPAQTLPRPVRHCVHLTGPARPSTARRKLPQSPKHFSYCEIPSIGGTTPAQTQRRLPPARQGEGPAEAERPTTSKMTSSRHAPCRPGPSRRRPQPRRDVLEQVLPNARHALGRSGFAGLTVELAQTRHSGARFQRRHITTVPIAYQLFHPGVTRRVVKRERTWVAARSRGKTMPFVITDPCIGTKDTACAVSGRWTASPRKDALGRSGDDAGHSPEECIDCGACVPACPVTAICARVHAVPDSQAPYRGQRDLSTWRRRSHGRC